MREKCLEGSGGGGLALENPNNLAFVEGGGHERGDGKDAFCLKKPCEKGPRKSRPQVARK